ncbi:unnamed protein product [Spirodela intermedia]|uniref:non-specific serine/threonine protein kinase n=1 Tax=Spirodela intermedia TaxID=51605 RepID=A0ABN7E7R7_SPIIN|nr:unnamed protein product [Spirodela intermedia]
MEEEDRRAGGGEQRRRLGLPPVRVGDALSRGRTSVQSEARVGHFSTVWLAWDTLHSRAALHRGGDDEITILKQIADGDPEDAKCVGEAARPFQALRPGITSVWDPARMVKEICRHVLVGLDYLHRQLNIIHTDLKPENILLVSTIDPARDATRTGAPLILPTSPTAPRPPFACALMSAAEIAGTNGDLTKNPKKKNSAEGETCCSYSKRGEHFGPRWDEVRSGKDDAGTAGNDGAAGLSRTTKEREVRAQEREQKCEEEIGHGSDLRCKLFTSDIQTRQYRCPEVLLCSKYSTPADLWSFACICFELATGDDHLALVMELLGMIARKPLSPFLSLITDCDAWFFFRLHGRPLLPRVFNRYGELRHIRRLRFLAAEQGAHREVRILTSRTLAPWQTSFLPILDFVPEKRPTAAQLLLHPWLNVPTPPLPNREGEESKGRPCGGAGEHRHWRPSEASSTEGCCAAAAVTTTSANSSR